MKILLEKLQKLERMEEIANHAEADYEREPENAEYEATFDLAYQNEFKAYIEAAKYIADNYSEMTVITNSPQITETMKEKKDFNLLCFILF